MVLKNYESPGILQPAIAAADESAARFARSVYLEHLADDIQGDARLILWRDVLPVWDPAIAPLKPFVQLRVKQRLIDLYRRNGLLTRRETRGSVNSGAKHAIAASLTLERYGEGVEGREPDNQSNWALKAPGDVERETLDRLTLIRLMEPVRGRARKILAARLRGCDANDMVQLGLGTKGSCWVAHHQSVQEMKREYRREEDGRKFREDWRRAKMEKLASGTPYRRG